jgi:hypothetical protein
MPVRAPVSQEFLRTLFKELAIWEKVGKGRLLVHVYWEGRTQPKHLPAGSLSQLLDYVTPEGVLLARVHQYKGPNGKVIGMPDPKYFRMGEIEFYIGEDP